MLKAEPGGQWDTAGELIGDSGEIEHDQSEAAALQDEVGGFQDLFKIVLAASIFQGNPQ